jgi:hypothetical protein
MDLSAFVGKLLEEQDGDVLREGIRVLSQALMEAEVAASIGAERHERTGERTAYRNGSRTRTWDTRVGTIELAIPKVTPGSYFPSLLQPRRLPEHALLAVGQEASVHGVSTRKVDELMKALGLDGVSKSVVSRIWSVLDPLVEAFRTRPLVGEHPYVWVDATYHKVRVDGHVTSQATVVAVGVTAEGERQVLGIDVGPSEDRAFWTAFLRGLVKRGAQRRAAGDLGRACGLETGDCHGLEWGDVAAVPRAFHAKPVGHRAARRPRADRGDRPDDLRATGSCQCDGAAAQGRRGPAWPLSESRGAARRGRGRCARVPPVSQ